MEAVNVSDTFEVKNTEHSIKHHIPLFLFSSASLVYFYQLPTYFHHNLAWIPSVGPDEILFPSSVLFHLVFFRPFPCLSHFFFRPQVVCASIDPFPIGFMLTEHATAYHLVHIFAQKLCILGEEMSFVVCFCRLCRGLGRFFQHASIGGE